MFECDHFGMCAFFNEMLHEQTPIGEVLKHRYCLGDNTRCARLLVRTRLGANKVPLDLWPNDLVAAERLLAVARV